MPFAIGDRVTHVIFGAGTVIAKNGIGEIGVEFDDPYFRGHHCRCNVVEGHPCSSSRGHWCREGQLTYVVVEGPDFEYNIGDRVYCTNISHHGTVVCILRGGASFGIEVDEPWEGHNCEHNDIVAGKQCTSGRGWFVTYDNLRPSNL